MTEVRTLVVLPTYNEAENIDEVLTRLRAALPECAVLVVDDGSPDGTADLAEKLDTTLGGISVLRRPAKSGLGSAYRAGFRWGIERGFEALIEMDADLSHDPAALPAMIDALSTSGAARTIKFWNNAGVVAKMEVLYKPGWAAIFFIALLCCASGS